MINKLVFTFPSLIQEITQSFDAPRYARRNQKTHAKMPTKPCRHIT